VECCYDVCPVSGIILFYSTYTFADSLTGLLSFMLSDEMTTGSINTSDADKRTYAAQSHWWNIQQRKFREAFPDVSVITTYRFIHRLEHLQQVLHAES
jgi:hypothetical protein